MAEKPSFTPLLMTATASVAVEGFEVGAGGLEIHQVGVGVELLTEEAGGGQVFINHGRGFFVRESRFRLNQDDKLYDIPVTSDKERYSEKVTTDPANEADRLRL